MGRLYIKIINLAKAMKISERSPQNSDTKPDIKKQIYRSNL